MKPALAVAMNPGEMRVAVPPSRRDVTSAPFDPDAVPCVSLWNCPPSISARAISFSPNMVVVQRPRARRSMTLSEPNCAPAPLSTRTERSIGFQARRKPTGMGEGTAIGVSAGSPIGVSAGCSGTANAGAAAARQSKAGRGRALGRNPRDRPGVANGFQHGARDEMGRVPARLQQSAHLRGRNLGDGDATFAMTRPLDGDDARELLHAIEALPLRLLGVEVGAEDQRPARVRVLAVEPLEQIHRPAFA